METGYTFNVENCEIDYIGLLENDFTPVDDVQDTLSNK